jgi:predicted RNA binding protein YcfA (HicA-like mRNA interferase family)
MLDLTVTSFHAAKTPPHQQQKLPGIVQEQECTPEDHPKSSRHPLENSTAVNLLAKQTITAFEQQQAGSTHISERDFNKFKSFALNNIPLIGESSFDSLWQDYTYLNRYQSSKRTIQYIKKEKSFIHNCWNIAALLNQYAEETSRGHYRLNFMQYLAEDKGLKLNQKAYKENIHPYFSIFQRFINLLGAIAKPIECMEEFGVSLLNIDDKRAFAFYQDSQGFVPIPFCCHSTETEIIYIHYGEQAFTSLEGCNGKAFIFEHGVLNTASGYILELTKNALDAEIGVNARGYYGGNKEIPFYATSKTIQTTLNSEHPGTRNLLSLIKDEVEQFQKEAKTFDVFFIPIPDTDAESHEFLYFLIQDLISQPKSNVEALFLLEYIESELNAPIEVISQQLEEQIKTKISSTYDKKIENSHEEIHPVVVQKAHKKGKRKAPRRTQRKVPQKKVTSSEDRLTKDFQAFKVSGPRKYKHVIKITQDLLKKMPQEKSELVKESQRGSHRTLHFPKGAATLVKPHGKKDMVSQKSTNTFIQKIITLIHSSLEGSNV